MEKNDVSAASWMLTIPQPPSKQIGRRVMALVSSATLCLSFSTSIQAGAFKCTDENGKTSYQSKPCKTQIDEVEINLKTGTVITHEMELRMQETELLKAQQQNIAEKKLAKLIADTKQQSAINQIYIKQNWSQFSAYAIPPYTLENIPENVHAYQTRLPEIERFRRLAAHEALNSGQCTRVEASELNLKSTAQKLIFLVDCRSGKQIYITEQELLDAHPDLPTIQ